MLDHIGLLVADYERSKAFFQKALSPLGYSLLMEHEISGAGFGRDGKPDFWIQPGELKGGVHVAFACLDRTSVDAFHTASIAAGATCNGAPGVRAEYHQNYYGAFVLDPDGNNIEAVCHRAE
jgi:catechol 2,3-dioxygenase-like lactoylglutathione lyase family enzyme